MLECTFGSVCRIDALEVASCVCDFQCPKTVKSVCGSDGLTYDNDCQRKSAQCKLKKEIELVKNGQCVKVNWTPQSLLYTPPSILNTNFQDPCENVECPAHQECRASFDGASARCACKGPCSGDSGSDSVVCGSDGENYPSLCHLGNLKASSLLLDRTSNIKFCS